MLYRLTHISEGSDYSWATALEDFVSDVGDLREFRTSGWSLPFAPENFASGLKNWFDQDSPFTREVTADVMYLMLSFNAGPEKESLTDQLTAGKKTELEKADALCEWIATHIYYDYVDLKAHIDDIKDQSAAAVLERRTAICDGYSALTLAMLRAAGLACYEETGRGNRMTHGWNVAFLDGEWVVIDNTWDSSLTYEKNPGEGYMCSYDHPELIFEVRAPKDYLEPQAQRSIFGSYFNMNYDDFYKAHTLWRQPLYASKTVLNVNHVLPQ